MAVLVTGSLLAQGTANESRLNMAYKKRATMEKSPLSYSPFVVNNQPLILEKSKALSTFYRTLLFGDNTTGQTVPTESNPSIAATVQRSEPQAVTFETVTLENENLFVSDKINVRNLYPNPANDYAYLEYVMTPLIKDAKISFYNVLGATVKEYALARSSQRLTVDTRLLPNGVYFYQLTVDGHKVATKKLLVRHHQ